ncbi:methionyl-tRNA formyltransferase [Pseudomonas bharatica]|uniref:methionyl-tRNA formyltransferase n=1 Tax=Pseudomonas bharatica TaxID=2692112 RepID=UPI003B2827CF
MLTIFAMTEKGLAFTELAISRFKDLISLVVIGQDDAVDDDFSSRIAEACQKSSTNFCFRHEHTHIESEYAIAISWRWMIKHPSDKLIVFHDSLLPRYRGFAPLVNALINGEPAVGVTALFGASEYDRGDIIHQASSAIEYPITIASAISTINKCYIECGEAVMTALARGAGLTAVPQDHSKATYSLWRDEQDYRLDWSLPASTLRRTIDALSSPYRGALCQINGVPARILAAEEVDDVIIENRTPGKVIFVEEGLPTIVCASGLLKILKCISDETSQDMLPLTRFRSRFT